ncbi:MAG: sodium:solute symporter family protein [Tumebacillaceae bacterium]
MNIALILILLFFLIALGLGLRARRGQNMNLEQWTVGGRSFGGLLVFLLMTGEIYTTFTLLGSSGWAYSKGGPTFYILAYTCLAYVMSYLLLPAIWRYAKQHNLLSQSDFFTRKYDSPALGILVALVGGAALIPYLVLQFKGLGILVSETSYGAIPPMLAVWIGMIVMTVYVMVSGIRGSAWTAALKDVMILGVVLFLGIYLPLHYYGGYQSMFEAIDAAKPGFLALPDHGLGVPWFISTVILTTLGFYMWPHTFGSAFSAKEERIFRQNAIFMPLYQLLILFAFFVGFAAILQVPGLTGSAGDLSLIKLSLQTFDPWLIGLIGAAGLLTALVPGSMLLMSASTLLAKNVYHHLRPATTAGQVSRLAKWLVPLLALVSVYFTLNGGETIVQLLLMGYSLVTQLFPALFCSLLPRNPVTKQGAIAGILAGVAAVAALPQTVQNLNSGVIALAVNAVAMFLVSLATRKK